MPFLRFRASDFGDLLVKALFGFALKGRDPGVSRVWCEKRQSQLVLGEGCCGMEESKD